MPVKKKRSTIGQGSGSDAGETPGGVSNSGNQKFLQDEMISRLKKIEGQVRGIQKMIQECRSCSDVVIQIAAVKAAVNRVGLTVLACHLADKIEIDLNEGKEVKDSLADFMDVFKKFS